MISLSCFFFPPLKQNPLFCVLFVTAWTVPVKRFTKFTNTNCIKMVCNNSRLGLLCAPFYARVLLQRATQCGTNRLVWGSSHFTGMLSNVPFWLHDYVSVQRNWGFLTVSADFSHALCNHHPHKFHFCFTDVWRFICSLISSFIFSSIMYFISIHRANAHFSDLF